MKTQRFLIGLTLINLFILLAILFFFSTAFKPDVAEVLRGYAFELLDEHGNIRAEIKIHPAEPSLKMPDGTVGYPETVIFRLIDSKGGPNVKVSATDDGAGIVLGNESGYVQILSRNAEQRIKFTDKKGAEKIIRIE